MTQALIQINGTTGSNDNLPIGVLVQLNNLGNGGELTYLWSLLDIPAGSTAVLSSTSVQNPTFTPDVEGTYLIQVIVNESLSSQESDEAIVGIRYLKSNQRAPAAGEEVEDGSAGWKPAVNAQLAELDNVQAGLTRVVAQSYSGAAAGDVVIFTGTQVIKSGLPGQETIPLVAKALATVGQVMGIIEASVTGGSTSDALVYVRISGLELPSFSGSPTLGQAVYLNPSTSQPTLTVESVVLGYVVFSSGGQWRFFIEGHATAASSTFVPGAGSGSAVQNNGSGNVAAGVNALALGEGASALREGQVAEASGFNSVAGDCQTSVLVLRGDTPGSVANETVELLYGASANQYLTLENGKTYAFVVTAAVGGVQSGPTRVSRSFRFSFNVRQDGGTPVITASGVSEDYGDSAAAGWTITPSVAASPERIALTFETSTTPSQCHASARVEFTEVVY